MWKIQRSDRGAGAKRARYNSSLLDANLTHSGDSYSDLNETYIVFITERDILKRGLPIYHIDRVVRETGDIFEDEAHIIYVNSQIKDETALGKLMHEFFLHRCNGNVLFYIGRSCTLFQRGYERSGKYVQSYGRNAK